MIVLYIILFNSTEFISAVLHIDIIYIHACIIILYHNESTDVVIEHSVIEIALTIVVDGIIINGYTNHLMRPLHHPCIYTMYENVQRNYIILCEI